MAVNKVIFNGDEIVNLTQDSAVENKVLEDYTFHKANGEAARGTYVPETPSGDDDYYTLTIDTDLPLEIGIMPTKPSIIYRDGTYDYNQLCAGFKVGDEFHIPTYIMLQLRPMGTPDEGYTIYINNEQVLAPVLRGEKGKTYNFRLVMNTVLDEPKQISASECRFAGNVLTSCNQTNFSNNIILPSSYSKQSTTINVDCRENNIEDSWQLENYLANNNILPPLTLTNGSNVLNIPSEEYFYEHKEEINQFFENAKYNWVLDPEQTQTYSYTIDGQIIEGDFGRITLIQGNINEVGSIIDNGSQFNYDTASSSYVSSEDKSMTYTFDTSTNTLTIDFYNQEYIDDWTVILSYEDATFVDGNDYQVTQLGNGNQPVFANQATNLRRIVIPNSYTRIALSATDGCGFVKEYVLSSNLTEIDGLNGICKSLILPNSLTSLNEWIGGMFKTLTIPSTVTNLQYLDAPLLETLTIESNNLHSIGGALDIPSCKSITGFQNIERFKGYLPSLLRVDSNEDGVLNFRGLTISEYGPLFGYGMGNNAHTINFEHLESIQSQMLERCPNVKNVTLPETLTSLNDIEISLGANIETLTVLSTTPPDLGFGLPMVNGRPQFAIYLNAIYVPAESVQAYREATNWTLYADLIQAKQ